ncbi:uncharacterized protein LOC125436847 isoform X2 [Sphaerodactylus townsendi]|nr:uncharacterized protein LOC125436847 isoform X2 [Sphaerodactylus townsendi]
MLKYPEEIISQYSEDEKEESQSILQVGLICPVISTDVCQSDCPSAATEHSIDLKMAGFLETSEKNVLQILHGDVPLETCSGTDTVKVGGDSIPRCLEISDIFQSITMTNKEDTIEKNLSPEIRICNITKGRRMAEMSDVKDVREALGDFDSQIMSPVVVDMLEYWNDTHYMDASVNEESCARPVELTDLNCLTESFAVCGDQAMEEESVHSPGKKLLVPDQRDDCTQITDTNFKPTFHLDIHEETEISLVTKLSCNSEQQLDCDPHNYKLVLSEHQSIRPAVLNEISSSEQTIQETSCALRKSARKRGTFIPDGSYATVDSYRFLEGLYQKKQRHKAQKKLPSKNSEYDI